MSIKIIHKIAFDKYMVPEKITYVMKHWRQDTNQSNLIGDV